jgi:TPR repeat protein
LDAKLSPSRVRNIAQASFATLADFGKAVLKNGKHAIKWFRLAARKSNNDAREAL